MSITIGNHTFDDVQYDAGGDVLYLHKGKPADGADWSETPEGHALSFDVEGHLIGLTIVRPRALLERHGKIELTLPQHFELGPAAIDGALVAA